MAEEKKDTELMSRDRQITFQNRARSEALERAWNRFRQADLVRTWVDSLRKDLVNQKELLERDTKDLEKAEAEYSADKQSMKYEDRKALKERIDQIKDNLAGGEDAIKDIEKSISDGDKLFKNHSTNGHKDIEEAEHASSFFVDVKKKN